MRHEMVADRHRGPAVAPDTPVTGQRMQRPSSAPQVTRVQAEYSNSLRATVLITRHDPARGDTW